MIGKYTMHGWLYGFGSSYKRSYHFCLEEPFSEDGPKVAAREIAWKRHAHNADRSQMM